MELVLQAYSLENVMRQKLFYETSFSKINEIVKIKITNLHDYFSNYLCYLFYLTGR